MEKSSQAQKAPRTYGGVSRAVREAARKERLFDSALELFAARGYAATTVEALSSHARISLRSFYEIVSDREDLLVQLYDKLIADMVSPMGEALRNAPSDLDALCRAGVEASVDAFCRDERTARIVFVEIFGVSSHVEQHRMAGRRLIADVMATAARRVVDDQVSDQVLRWRVFAMIGAFESVLMQWLAEPKRASIPLLVDTISRAVAGILASR
jgi:AcrR family transcriptional regulator